jgi:hypothetical protein
VILEPTKRRPDVHYPARRIRPETLPRSGVLSRWNIRVRR